MNFGLCDSCRHQRIVRSGRGSTFSMCEIGQTDPQWPKYPRMPVTNCQHHEPAGCTRNEVIAKPRNES